MKTSYLEEETKPHTQTCPEPSHFYLSCSLASFITASCDPSLPVHPRRHGRQAVGALYPFFEIDS